MSERRESGEHPRAVFRDVLAVEPETFLADAKRGVRIAQLECALSAIGIFAQQPIEVVEDGENESGADVDPVLIVAAGREFRVTAVNHVGFFGNLQHRAGARLSALSYTVRRPVPMGYFRRALYDVPGH